MLAHNLRRWPNFKLTLGQCLRLAGIPIESPGQAVNKVPSAVDSPASVAAVAAPTPAISLDKQSPINDHQVTQWHNMLNTLEMLDSQFHKFIHIKLVSLAGFHAREEGLFHQVYYVCSTLWFMDQLANTTLIIWQILIVFVDLKFTI